MIESALKETISICLDDDQMRDTTYGMIVFSLACLSVQGTGFQDFGDSSDEEEAKRIIGAPVGPFHPDFEGTALGIHLPIIQLSFYLDGGFTT